MKEQDKREDNSASGSVNLNRGPNWLVIILVGLVLLGVTNFLTYQFAMEAYLGAGKPSGWGEAAEVYEEVVKTKEFKRFLEAMTLTKNRYIEDVSLNELLEGAIDGMVRATGDEYSRYYDQAAYESFEITTSGEYEGIGARVIEKTVSDQTYVTVLSPFEGTPAATTPFEGSTEEDPVGLKPGDRIVEVNGESIVGTPLRKAAQMMRGPAGTEVTVKVLREGRDEPLIFHIERAAVTIPSISSRVIEDKYGYVKMTQFNQNTPQQFREAMESLQSQNIEGLILDLRNNPGGSLEATGQIADFFLSQGVVVRIKQRGQGERVIESSGSGYDKPVVILVNKGSASASEILTGAMQDRGVATVVGETTFGKASVQSIWELSDETGLKITTATYLTPEGRQINGVGLEPDIEVPLDDGAELGDLETDNQLQKALSLLKEGS